MKRIWWAQIKAVIRLEMRKTFFAKRGLWIYAIAALPVILFVAYAIATSTQQHRRATVVSQGEKRLTYQDLQAIKPGMTSDEVIAILGRPPLRFHWTDRRPASPEQNSEKETMIEVQHEEYRYSDGQNDLYVGLGDDKVESINLQQGNNPGQDSIMFAGVFQFFFLRLAIFFGCLGIFMNLFRGEILDRSLHFYFLAPVRREVVMAGKFLAGLLATCTIFVTSEVMQTIGSVVTNLALAIRGASAVTLISAILVLGGALAAGHRHRVYDAVVLKTLGATRRQLLTAYALEYLLLGLATVLFGVVAGSLAAWRVVADVMTLRFEWQGGPAIAAALLALVITLLFGLIGTFAALGRKPAAVLRNL